MKTSARLLLIFTICSFQLGCANFGKSLKSFVGGGGAQSEPMQKKSRQLKFSEAQSVPYDNKYKNYQRMTKERFEEQAGVHKSREGSLWVMEGQGSYLFSSNTLRLVGDIVNVKLEGSPKAQLQTKVGVIKDLVARLEKPKRKPAAATKDATAQQEAKTPTPDDTQPPAAQANANEPVKEKEEEAVMGVDVVPARIVDRTVEGNYRIKGTQTFMIGKREYRVIVTGLVRPSDMNGDEISAPNILEPKFDVVSLKKELKL